MLFNSSQIKEKVMLVELSKIHGSADPIRKSWSEEQMAELTESIRQLGVIMPIKLRENDGGYEIVYGHRRVEAARRAGLSHIPADIDDLSDADSVKQAIVENVVREDMSEFQKGEAFSQLHNRYAMSLQGISEFVGLKPSSISRFISLVEDSIWDYANLDPDQDLHNLSNLAIKVQLTRSLGEA